MNNSIYSEDYSREDLKKEMCDLLTEFEYPVGQGVDKIIDTWETNKRDIIESFKRHPNYNGRFQIVFSHDYNREINTNAVHSFALYLNNEVLSRFIAIEENDSKVSFYDLYNKEISIKEEYSSVVDKLLTLIGYMQRYVDHQFLTDDDITTLNYKFSDYKLSSGQKVSRAIRKILKGLGVENFADTEQGKEERREYEREYAKFSDAINPLKITRHTIISCNPIDYYTMSFGNSWASCHTIDKENLRDREGDSYSGCYSSGTESYMLDNSSIIFYTVDSSYNGVEFELEDKVNRCMFHIGNEKIVQGRVYPQSNDSVNDIYKDIREIVQSVISTCWNIPNLWTNVKGTGECKSVILSDGTHYKDYYHFEKCNVSYVQDHKNKDRLTIGHLPICPNCGKEHDQEDFIVCKACSPNAIVCSSCGCIIEDDEEDGIWIDGECYCSDCVFYCDYHDCWEPINGSIYEVNGLGTVCEEALGNENIIQCDFCDSYFYDINQGVETEDGYHYCCDQCAIEDGAILVDGKYNQFWLSDLSDENLEYYNVHYCNNCNTYFEEDTCSVFIEDEDIYFCSNQCAEEDGYFYDEDEDKWEKECVVSM